MPSPLSFLLIGIAWSCYPAMVGPERAEAVTQQVKAALASDRANFEALGLGYTFVDYGPEEEMGRLKGILKEGKFDGVAVGYGIRANKEFTPLFERVVNTIHTASPSSRLLFNHAPDGTLDAARRQFPEIARLEQDKTRAAA